MLTIAIESPVQPDLELLHARHHAAMHAETPPASIHMLPPDALAAEGISFYVLRKAGEAVGMGAFKRHDAALAEIKSMHVLEEHRGGGLSRRLLEHLLAEARAAGVRRVCLETGAEKIFIPARGLYERAGFSYCGPFADYVEDPNSVFMSLEL